MKLDKLICKLENICPTAYLQFPKPQKPPYILCALPNNDIFSANNKPIFKVQNGWLELYTQNTNFELMEKVEKIFLKNKLPFEKENEIYVDTIKLFMVRWGFQLF